MENQNLTKEEELLLNLLIEKIDKMDAKLEDHMAKESENVNTLMETFNTAKHVIWFIKWTAVFISAIGLTWAWLYNHFTIGVK